MFATARWLAIFTGSPLALSDVQVAREIGLASFFFGPQQIIRTALEDDTQSLYRMFEKADLVVATDFTNDAKIF